MRYLDFLQLQAPARRPFWIVGSFAASFRTLKQTYADPYDKSTLTLSPAPAVLECYPVYDCPNATTDFRHKALFIPLHATDLGGRTSKVDRVCNIHPRMLVSRSRLLAEATKVDTISRLTLDSAIEWGRRRLGGLARHRMAAAFTVCQGALDSGGRLLAANWLVQLGWCDKDWPEK